MNEPFDRAWRRVGLALDRVGFTVEDRDRSKGLYFVRYVDPESEMAIKDSRAAACCRKLFSASDQGSRPSSTGCRCARPTRTSQVQVLNKDGAAEKLENRAAHPRRCCTSS